MFTRKIIEIACLGLKINEEKRKLMETGTTYLKGDQLAFKKVKELVGDRSKEC